MASTYTTSGSCSTSVLKRSSAARTRSSLRLRSPRSRIDAVKIGGPGSSQPRDRDLDRELVPVGVPRGHLDPPAEPVAGDIRRECLRPAPPAAPVCPGQDEPGELAPEDVVPPIAEELLRRPVELEHAPAVVDRHDDVEHGPDGPRSRALRRTPGPSPATLGRARTPVSARYAATLFVSSAERRVGHPSSEVPRPGSARAGRGAERREEHHVADRLLPRQEHHEAVDAEAEAPGRGHPVGQRLDVVRDRRARPPPAPTADRSAPAASRRR